MEGDAPFFVWADAMKRFTDEDVYRALSVVKEGAADQDQETKYITIPNLAQFCRYIQESKKHACHKIHPKLLGIERKPTDEEIRNGNEALKALKQSLSK